MRSRLARLALSAATVAGLGLVASAPGAHATTACPQSYDCGPPPRPLPIPPFTVAKPTVGFGCGTVIVTEGAKSWSVQVLPCPGPVIV
jgi:hypothetical protein